MLGFDTKATRELSGLISMEIAPELSGEVAFNRIGGLAGTEIGALKSQGTSASLSASQTM